MVKCTGFACDDEIEYLICVVLCATTNLNFHVVVMISLTSLHYIEITQQHEKSLLVDGLISSSQLPFVKMMTLRVQIVSLVSVFFVLQTNPSYAVPINVDEDFLKPLCENPPPVLQLVCKSLFGVTCPTQVKFGDWTYNGTEVDNSLNSTAASACPGVRLQTYERTTNLSTILSECRSKVIVQTEEEYRCEY